MFFMTLHPSSYVDVIDTYSDGSHRFELPLRSEKNRRHMIARRCYPADGSQLAIASYDRFVLCGLVGLVTTVNGTLIAVHYKLSVWATEASAAREGVIATVTMSRSTLFLYWVTRIKVCLFGSSRTAPTLDLPTRVLGGPFCGVRLRILHALGRINVAHERHVMFPAVARVCNQACRDNNCDHLLFPRPIYGIYGRLDHSKISAPLLISSLADLLWAAAW